jgi:hypothetical protein
MKLSLLLTTHAVLALGFGIAFTLYAPVMMAFFGIPELPGDNVLLYWSVVSFARMFGVTLFGLGMILWALRGSLEGAGFSSPSRRGILFAMLFGNAIGSITAITQQVSVWQGIAGWITFGIFLLLTLAYGYFLFSMGK